jgi:alpha-L-fucosidase
MKTPRDQTERTTLINPASRHDPNLQWFRDARLGLFIHYSVVASRHGVTEHMQAQKRISDEDYRREARTCALERFSAAHWVDQAEAMGARYVTLVCKHHDGFCFWDTKTTDFNIMNTAFGRDLVREVSDECRRRGIRFCVYCSQPDWHARTYAWKPGAWGDRQWSVSGEQPDHEKYLAYLRRQLTELLTNYGEVSGVWFDASDWTEARWRGRELYALIKKLQAQAAVNERAGYGDYLSAEVQLDETIDGRLYMQEQCLSVARHGWAYHADSDWRSARELVDIVVRMIGCGSNLLLNIGPTGDGTVPEPATSRLRELGQWMKTHAEAVYGTEAVRPAGLPDTVRAARRGDDIFLFLREWPFSDRLEVPGLPGRPARAELMGSGPLPLDLSGKAGTWRIEGLPASRPTDLPAVLKLSFDRSPIVIRPQPAPVAEHVVTVASDMPNILPVTLAACRGFRCKNFRHHVAALVPPDAAFSQEVPELGWLDATRRGRRNAGQTDQARMWAEEDGDKRFAICDWRGVDQTIVNHLWAEGAFTARLRLLLRVPEGFGGSLLAVRCGDCRIEPRIRGNPGVEARRENGPDWWQGWRNLPFVWEDMGEIAIPAGRSTLELQPAEIPYGCFVADVAGVWLDAGVGRGA